MMEDEPEWQSIFSARDLGRFLTALRKRRDLTQAELAAELGVSRQYVSEIEAGKPGLYSERLFATLRLLDGSLRGEFPG